MEQKLQCEICGDEIIWSGMGRKKKYCDHCSKLSQRRYSKDWHDEHKEERKEYMREYLREYMRGYYQDKDNLKKHTVRMRTNYLIRSGKIKMQEQCAICGATDNLQSHHISYDDQLAEYAIVTLCHSCHSNLHNNNNVV